MNSHKQDRAYSIFFVVIGGVLGFDWGGKLARGSLYWSIRLSIAGLVLGIIAGALAGYLRVYLRNR